MTEPSIWNVLPLVIAVVIFGILAYCAIVAAPRAEEIWPCPRCQGKGRTQVGDKCPECKGNGVDPGVERWM